MKRFLLIFLLIPLVGAGKEKAKHTPSKSQIETVKDWLQTEGIQDPDASISCDGIENGPLQLGTFNFNWPGATYSYMLCSRPVGVINSRKIKPDGLAPLSNEYGQIPRSTKQVEFGTESILVIEVPVESAIKYKAIYTKKVDSRIARDTVNVRFRIHYVMNTRALPYGYLAAIVPRSENPRLLDNRDYLENFNGYVLGMKFDGTPSDIPRVGRGNIVRKSQSGWHSPTSRTLKYIDGHQDWDFVEIYRLTPSGEFGKLVVRLK